MKNVTKPQCISAFAFLVVIPEGNLLLLLTLSSSPPRPDQPMMK
jgi:hypothetical protein